MSFYQRIISSGNIFQHFLLLAMRLYWGYGFFYAGMGKFSDMDLTIQFFSNISIPFPFLSAYIAATIELVGGILLLVGLGSRLVAIPLAIVMIVALLTAHYPAVATIFDDPFNFIIQKPFSYLLATLVVYSFGPGAISLDAMLKKAWDHRD